MLLVYPIYILHILFTLLIPFTQIQNTSLFSLIETCQSLNIDQLARLTVYAKALSDITPDSDK